MGFHGRAGSSAFDHRVRRDRRWSSCTPRRPGPATGVALAAVGSLARRELGPRSDIDLVLLHDGKHRQQIDELADQLWYPLWDAGIRLDHSVRTPAECADVAGRELSAGVGLLDLRAVAGDAALVKRRPDGAAGRLARQRPQAAAGAAGRARRAARRRSATRPTCSNPTSRRPAAASGT